MVSWMIWFSFLLTICVIFAATACFSFMFKGLKQVETHLAENIECTQILSRKHADIQQMFAEQQKQLAYLQTENDQFKEILEVLQAYDPEHRLYSRAIKMIALGADLQEVMTECELPKPEAELLFSLHSQRKQSA